MTKTEDISVTSSKFEVIKSMEGFVAENLSTLLKRVEDSWQPQDFLPDPARDDWSEQVRELRLHARNLPDDVLVVLVGDMITEEALPTYQTWINRLQGVGTRRVPATRHGHDGAEADRGGKPARGFAQQVPLPDRSR